MKIVINNQFGKRCCFRRGDAVCSKACRGGGVEGLGGIWGLLGDTRNYGIMSSSCYHYQRPVCQSFMSHSRPDEVGVGVCVGILGVFSVQKGSGYLIHEGTSHGAINCSSELLSSPFFFHHSLFGSCLNIIKNSCCCFLSFVWYYIPLRVLQRREVNKPLLILRYVGGGGR